MRGRVGDGRLGARRVADFAAAAMAASASRNLAKRNSGTDFVAASDGRRHSRARIDHIFYWAPMRAATLAA